MQSQHWPCVRRLAHTVGLSALEALKIEHDESETITAMAGLSMQSMNRYALSIQRFSKMCLSKRLLIFFRTLSRDDSEEPMDQDEAK